MRIQIPNPKKVLIANIEKTCGLVQYGKTISIPNDVATNEEYQKNFTGYYRVRRDKEWLKKYYQFMQENKDNKNLTFREIVEYLYSVPHRCKETNNNNGFMCSIEASFSSKMLATINPNYPIWDSQVIKAVGIELPNNQSERNIDLYVSIYDELCKKVNEFIETLDGKKCIEEFDLMFPNYTWVSSTKKIDFFLWTMGN